MSLLVVLPNSFFRIFALAPLFLATILLAERPQAQSDILIVPGKRVGPFEIGMSMDQVKAAVPAGWREGQYQDYDVGDGRKIAVHYEVTHWRVDWIQTTSPRFRTPEGAGVGTARSELETAYRGKDLELRLPPPFVGDF